jgi:hypothetical protein
MWVAHPQAGFSPGFRSGQSICTSKGGPSRGSAATGAALALLVFQTRLFRSFQMALCCVVAPVASARRSLVFNGALAMGCSCWWVDPWMRSHPPSPPRQHTPALAGAPPPLGATKLAASLALLQAARASPQATMASPSSRQRFHGLFTLLANKSGFILALGMWCMCHWDQAAALTAAMQKESSGAGCDRPCPALQHCCARGGPAALGPAPSRV